MRQVIRLLATTALLVVSMASVAGAGMIPVVTFEEIPSDFEAGTPYRLDYSIKAHGVEPMELADSSLRFIGPGGKTLTFPAVSIGAGEWTAEVTLPQAGEWQWEVVTGTQVLQTLSTISVTAAPASASSSLMTSLRIALPIATLLALVLLVSQVLPRARVDRHTPPVTDVL